MNPNPDRSPPSLLADTLESGRGLQLRVDSLEMALELARVRRRRRTQQRWAIGTGLPVLGLALVIWLGAKSANPSANPIHPSPSVPEATGIRMATWGAGSDYRTIHSQSAGYAVVTTDPTLTGVRILSDRALLALFPNRPRALVEDGQGHSRLVFLDEPGWAPANE